MSDTMANNDYRNFNKLLEEGRLIYDADRGEYIDTATGQVIDEREISIAKDWREYSIEDSYMRARAGPPTTNIVHDYGLTTYVDGYDRKSRKIRNLVKTVRKPTDSKGRKELEAKKLMNDAIGKLGLPQYVAETSGQLIKKAIAKNMFRKNTIRAGVASIILEVCKCCSIPIDKRVIYEIFGVSEKDVFNMTKKMSLSGLFNEVRRNRANKVTQSGDTISNISSAISFISMIASKVGFNSDIAVLGERIVKSSIKANIVSLTGKNPVGSAAAALYLASIILGDKRSQRDMADALDLSEVTIRNRYRDLIDNLDIIIYV